MTDGTPAVASSSGGTNGLATTTSNMTSVGTSDGASNVNTTVGGTTTTSTSSGGAAVGGSTAMVGSGGASVGGSTVTGVGGDSTVGSTGDGGTNNGGTNSGGAGVGNGGTAGGSAQVGCTSELALCDDFESYAMGQVPDGRWQTVRTPMQGATMAVDDTKAFSGTQALHITANFQNYTGVNISTKSGDAAFATGDTYYVRFMLFQTALTNTDELHARMVRIGTADLANGNDGSGYTFGLHSYPKPIALQLESMNDTFVTTRIDPPLDRWVCWELEYGPDTIGWWQDGEAIDTPEPGGWAQVTMSTLELGFEAYSAVTTELWYDDIAVDTERIGCPVAQ